MSLSLLLSLSLFPTLIGLSLSLSPAVRQHKPTISSSLSDSLQPHGALLIHGIYTRAHRKSKQSPHPITRPQTQLHPATPNLAQPQHDISYPRSASKTKSRLHSRQPLLTTPHGYIRLAAHPFSPKENICAISSGITPLTDAFYYPPSLEGWKERLWLHPGNVIIIQLPTLLDNT